MARPHLLPIVGLASWSFSPPDASSPGERRSGPRHIARRIVGPVAVESHHAPLDAPALADHAGVLGNRIMDRVPAPIRYLDDTAAEATRNGVRRPWPECGFADQVEAPDVKGRLPETVFLEIEARADEGERPEKFMSSQLAAVAVPAAETASVATIAEPRTSARLDTNCTPYQSAALR